MTAMVVEALDLKNVAKHGEPAGRFAKAVLVSAAPPLILKTEAKPEGLPLEVFDGLRSALAANRAPFFRDVPAVLQRRRRSGPERISILMLLPVIM